MGRGGYSLDPVTSHQRSCDVTEANGQKCTVSGAGSPGVTFVDPLGTLTINKKDTTTAGNLLAGATFTISPNPFYCTSGTPGGAPSPGAAASGSFSVTDGGASDPDGLANGIISFTGTVCIGSYTI